MKIPRQVNTQEFKEQAVGRVAEGQTPAAVARELGLIEQTLQNWVKRATMGKLAGAGSKLMMLEETELSQLRAENLRLSRMVRS